MTHSTGTSYTVLPRFQTDFDGRTRQLPALVVMQLVWVWTQRIEEQVQKPSSLSVRNDIFGYCSTELGRLLLILISSSRTSPNTQSPSTSTTWSQISRSNLWREKITSSKSRRPSMIPSLARLLHHSSWTTLCRSDQFVSLHLLLPAFQLAATLSFFDFPSFVNSMQ